MSVVAKRLSCRKSPIERNGRANEIPKNLEIQRETLTLSTIAVGFLKHHKALV